MEGIFLQSDEECIYCTEENTYWAAACEDEDEFDGPEDVVSSRWESCMERGDFEHVWCMNDEEEHEKYKEIRARLTAEDKNREQTEERIVREYARWEGRLSTQVWRRDAFRAQLDPVIEAISKVRLNQASLEQAEIDHAAYLRHMEEQPDHGRPFKLKRVVISEDYETEFKEVTVTTTLRHSRYYLGHQGGDYIFRYKEPEPSFVEMACGKEQVWPLNSWHHPCWLNYFLSTDPPIGNRFTYCGQVPRPQSEYMTRLEALYPDVTDIVASAIQFLAATQGKCPCRVSEGLCATNFGRVQLGVLRALWDACVRDGQENMIGFVRVKARSNPKILEFAFVTARVAAAHKQILGQLEQLLKTLEGITGWSFFEMINQHDLRTAEIAHQELFSTTDFSRFMIFQDDTFDNVHELYDCYLFSVDPVHPLQQYRHIDVSAAIELSERLWQLDLTRAASLDPQDSAGAALPSKQKLCDSGSPAPPPAKKRRGRPRKYPVTEKGARRKPSSKARTTVAATSTEQPWNLAEVRAVIYVGHQPGGSSSADPQSNGCATDPLGLNTFRASS